MNVLIAGANGRTGKRLIPLLVKRGHLPIAMARDDSQAPALEKLGAAKTIVADLERPLEHCFDGTGIDAVVFVAGSGSKTGKDKTIFIDHLGAIRLAATAEFAGARRFVMLSAIGASPSSDHPAISHYTRAKGWADVWLRQRDIDWTIVKPGRLTEDPGQATISISPHFGHSGNISLDDVALTLAVCIDKPSSYRKEFDILEGATPIEDAIESL